MTEEDGKLDQIIRNMRDHNKDIKDSQKNIYDKLTVLGESAARIEERVAAVKEDLEAHEQSDNENFKEIDGKMTTMQVEAGVAKAVAGKTGGKYGLASSGGLVLVVEAIKKFFLA